MNTVLTLLLCVGILLGTNSCDNQISDPDPELSECLKTQIEAFKKRQEAVAVIMISRPDGPQYWFQESGGPDGLDEVLNWNCELVCVICHDCAFSNSPIYCDITYYYSPHEVIWKK